MTKSELRDKIKAIALQNLKPKSVDLDKGNDVSLDALKFPVLGKFPDLKKIIVSLLTKQYEVFMSDIQWVAPRPTTFRIILGNKETFYLIYTERSWIAKVEGKKYYLLNLSEEESAAESIARILAYGAPKEEEDPTGNFKDEIPEINPEDFATPDEETPEEETPEENTPPPVPKA
jgi:hypothetical protein